MPRGQGNRCFIEACNCNHGCNCQFGGFPDHGGSEAMIGGEVIEGSYGDGSVTAILSGQAGGIRDPGGFASYATPTWTNQQ